MIVAVLATGVVVNAQDKTFEFALKAGVNMAQFNTDLSGVDPSMKTSFYGGLQGELHMTRTLSLMGEVLYEDAGSKLKSGSTEVKLTTSMIDLPLALKLYLVENKLSLHAGVALGIMLSASDDASGYTVAVEGDDYDYFDLGIIFGAEYKIGKHFFIDARYKYGGTSIQPDMKMSTIQAGVGYRF